jgi:hypothetical protein
MAYKKRSKKKTTNRRKKRIGAIGKNLDVMGAVSVIAGAVAGRYLVKAVNVPNVKDNIKNAVIVAAGLFLPKLIKSPMGKSIGLGMVAAGGIGLASEFLPKIAGVEDTLSFPMMVSGTDGDLSLIAGDDVMSGDLSLIAGMDEDDY